jgi:hypothetical protein
MLGRTLFIVLVVSAGSVGFAGCGGETARSAPTPRTHASSVGTDADENLSHRPFPRSPRPSRKEYAREAFLSTYHNPEEGISFRYPRNYSLEEGDIQESSFFLKRQDDLDSEQPGANLVATILIPEDGYPNTTFEHGSLQLAVNEASTEKECRESSLIGAKGNSPRVIVVQGIEFLWRGQETAIAGTKILERSYAGYSQATCYEFLLTVAAEEAPDADGIKKPAYMDKIMKQLEKIVASARFSTKSATPPSEDIEKSDGPLVITTSEEQTRQQRPQAER